VNTQTNEGVAIKKVTNVFSKKILAKRALREIKLLQHFRGHRNVCSFQYEAVLSTTANSARLPACMTWTFHAQTTLTKLIYMKVRNPIHLCQHEMLTCPRYQN
jgi:hypothetical protein